jgi:hypothetical protein
MAVQSASVLRLALSAVLPVILVIYVAWHSAAQQQEAPQELYAIWNSAQNAGTGGYMAPTMYAQQPMEQAPGVYAAGWYNNPVNTAELKATVNPYDAAALQYSSSGKTQGQVQSQMQTLHALASAKRLYHNMQEPAQGGYNSAVSTAANPSLALQSLQKTYAGSAASKQIGQAQLAIEKVLQQSKADTKMAKAATRIARRTTDKGNSWNSILSRESGPQATAMASDWLATAVATNSKGKKNEYARAQLEAALSQVDGHFHHNAEAGAWANQKRERNSELAAMSKLANAVMYKALSGTAGGPSSAVAPMAPDSYSTSSPSAWSSNSAGAGYQGMSSSSMASGMGGGGGGGSAGKAARGGAAPGLSSYDAQILANGPPE